MSQDRVPADPPHQAPPGGATSQGGQRVPAAPSVAPATMAPPQLPAVFRKASARRAIGQPMASRWGDRGRFLVMSVTLELSPEAVARLRAEADRRQLSMDAVVEDLAASLPAAMERPTRRRLSFVGMGASSSGRTASDADEMLADGFGRDRQR